MIACSEPPKNHRCFSPVFTAAPCRLSSSSASPKRGNGTGGVPRPFTAARRGWGLIKAAAARRLRRRPALPRHCIFDSLRASTPPVSPLLLRTLSLSAPRARTHPRAVAPHAALASPGRGSTRRRLSLLSVPRLKLSSVNTARRYKSKSAHRSTQTAVVAWWPEARMRAVWVTGSIPLGAKAPLFFFYPTLTCGACMSATSMSTSPSTRQRGVLRGTGATVQ